MTSSLTTTIIPRLSVYCGAVPFERLSQEWRISKLAVNLMVRSTTVFARVIVSGKLNAQRYANAILQVWYLLQHGNARPRTARFT